MKNVRLPLRERAVLAGTLLPNAADPVLSPGAAPTGLAPIDRFPVDVTPAIPEDPPV